MIGWLTSRHVASWEAPDRHQQKALEGSDGWSSSRGDRDRTAGGRLASNHRTALDDWGRTRSRRDRAAIAARSRLRWHQAGAESFPVDRQTIDDARAARSSPIAPQFSRDHGENRGMIVAKIMAISPRNWSRCTLGVKPRHRPKEPLPRSHESTSTTASIGHDLRANFSLKTHVVLHCFLTFDWFVKELSEFRGKS